MTQQFQSTYANKYGETWLFEYDAATDAATIQGSDIGKDVYKVIEGIAYDLVLDKEERQWLLSAWEEASGRKSSLQEFANL